MVRMRGNISERVIQRVATATNSDALELPPLYDAIEPEALDTLVAKMSDGKISFTYAGHDITVTCDGSISLSERPADCIAAEPAVSDD